MGKRGSPFRCYLSWVAYNGDPWSNWWDSPNDEDGVVSIRGRPCKPLPDDHPEWPGVPAVNGESPPLLATGPTLATLLHPCSSHSIDEFDAVYLLFRPEDHRPSHEALKEAMARICEARGLGEAFRQKVKFVPISKIDDPTNHNQVCEALEAYLKGLDAPLRLNEKRLTREVFVNLSPGTPTMHACWLMLYWRGTFGSPPQTTVSFLQGDGGFGARSYNAEAEREPVRAVPVDVIARFSERTSKTAQSTTSWSEAQGRTFVGLDDLTSSKYVDLRKQIAQAAMLGLPIVLHGPRGSGKTFLAQHYHERRQDYLTSQGRLSETKHKQSQVASSSRRRQRPAVGPPLGSPKRQLVPVTLSEYRSVEDLSSTLFGWKAGTFTGADSEVDNDGLLGEAHQGTLFLDEIHHLDERLQAALLGAMNTGRYRPGRADYEVKSDFSLVVATNEPQWQKKLLDDFRDRIVRVVLEVPPFKEVRRDGLVDLQTFWEHVLRDRCRECGVDFVAPTEDCEARLSEILKNKPLDGNWRDLARLADHVLMLMTDERDGRPTPLTWDMKLLEAAIDGVFADDQR